MVVEDSVVVAGVVNYDDVCWRFGNIMAIADPVHMYCEPGLCSWGDRDACEGVCKREVVHWQWNERDGKVLGCVEAVWEWSSYMDDVNVVVNPG